MNVVCLRVRGVDDADHDALAAEMQNRGASVLSTTTFGGRRVLRAAIVNHRAAQTDVDAIIHGVREAARQTMVIELRPTDGGNR